MAEFSWSKVNYVLGVSVMDDAHEEFITLYNELMNTDDSHFAELFDKFYQHTKDHFEEENQLMEDTDYPGIKDHKGEHQRVINELNYFKGKVDEKKFSFPRFYLKDRIPTWFRLHLSTMDSALVAHINKTDLEKTA